MTRISFIQKAFRLMNIQFNITVIIKQCRLGINVDNPQNKNKNKNSATSANSTRTKFNPDNK
jgi:hypothetical protein